MAHLKRNFDCRSIFVPGAKPQPAYRIQCSRCAAHDSVSANGVALPAMAVARKFEARGWNVSDRNACHDICPKCMEPILHAKKEPKVDGKSAANVLAMPVKAEAPEPMSREDRRVIFAKLNDVYGDEKSGYGDGWGDGRVAQDLGVPVAWVRSIREENFGPDGANDEIRGLLKEARECAGDIKKHVDQIAGVRAGIESLSRTTAKLESRLPDLETRSKRIEAHLAKISKQVGVAQ